MEVLCVKASELVLYIFTFILFFEANPLLVSQKLIIVVSRKTLRPLWNGPMAEIDEYIAQ